MKRFFLGEGGLPRRRLPTVFLGSKRLSPLHSHLQAWGCLPQEAGKPDPYQPGSSSSALSPGLLLLPAVPPPGSGGFGDTGGVEVCQRGWEAHALRWPGGAFPLLPFQEAQHNFTACHSCVPLSVSQADPAHPPLYWFLSGLQNLITYTCSWETQAGLRGDGPSD